MRRHLLVFDDGNGSEVDLRSFVDSLDKGADMLALDGHVCFLKSALSAQEVSERFVKFVGSRLFFVTDMTDADCAGRMPGFFWDDLKRPQLSAAAE
jgi:hypothetical protein